MAKKRDGGGSNLGLIITLVFFVLTTVILGITTYIGYSGQEELIKGKNAESAKANQAEADAKWYRFLYRGARLYMEDPPAGFDFPEFTREKQQFGQGLLAYAVKQTDKDEADKWLKGLDGRMPWGTDRPSTTYAKILSAQADRINVLTKAVDNEKTAMTKAKADFEAEKSDLQGQIAAKDEALKKFQTQVAADRTQDKQAVDKKLKEIDDKGTKLEKLSADLAEANKKIETVTRQLTKTQQERRELNDDRNRLKDRYEEVNEKLKYVVDKTKFDIRDLDAKLLTANANAKDKLERWTRDWRIISMDRTGNMPYVSLGSADRVAPQMTFSIHAVKPDGRLEPIPKATLEIVRVVGPHMAQARIPPTKDIKREPVLPGDRLFHPTWSPNQKKYLALAGVVDLDGDGTDGTIRFRQMLQKQNIELDSYIDISDEKNPVLWERQKGRPITVDTEYLILGYGLGNLRETKNRPPEYSKQFDLLMKKLKDTANENAVKMIRLPEYLELMGYTPLSNAKR